MKKIVLKSLAITLSAISLLNVSPINALDDNKTDEPKIIQQLPEKDITLEGNPDPMEEIKLLGIEIVVGAGVLALARVIVEKNYNYWIEQKRNEELKKFEGRIGENILTKRQEGAFWDWLACLQGMLKNRGIEKSQKELFKGITGKFPGWFETTRYNNLKETHYNDSLFWTSFKLFTFSNEEVGFAAAQKYIIKEFKLNLWKYKISVFGDNTTEICDYIKETYKNNNNKPFAICDSLGISRPVSSDDFMQMVNVVEIQGDYITIESPLTGLRRTENIYDFVKRYNEKKFFKDSGIFLFGIS